jgi:hypothetical protein
LQEKETKLLPLLQLLVATTSSRGGDYEQHEDGDAEQQRDGPDAEKHH